MQCYPVFYLPANCFEKAKLVGFRNKESGLTTND